MRNLVILCGALAVAACGSEKSGTIETEDGKAEYTVDNSGDGGSMTIKSKEGEFNLKSGSDASDLKLPAGFTIYPGSEVVTNATMTHDQGSNINVIMTTKASPDQVVAFYRKQATAAGVEISSEMKMDKVQIIGGETKGGLTFSLNTSPSDDGKTTASISLAQASGK